MSSHVNSNVKYKFKKLMNHKNRKLGEFKNNRGKVHEYLGMTSDLLELGKVKIRMDDYV